eukprot:g489.t1
MSPPGHSSSYHEVWGSMFAQFLYQPTEKVAKLMAPTLQQVPHEHLLVGVHYRSHYFNLKGHPMEEAFAQCLEQLPSKYSAQVSSKKVVIFLAADNIGSAAVLRNRLQRTATVIETHGGPLVHALGASLPSADGGTKIAPHMMMSDAEREMGVLRAFADFFTIQVCDALVMSERSTWARDATKYYKNAIVPVVKIKVGKVPAWCR